ncbi:conserved hypothetical protein [Methylocella tundrae]|uniref:Uncharacterized protein n=2 Tax=Methylocella tundrae TaxID=227605 RepID=A0A4U8Z212_METTU|nr:conserved protein of unknown function [Methylocella tundrae]VTZ48388.1 conserved hypothetical protein [Methylocella tundrae]
MHGIMNRLFASIRERAERRAIAAAEAERLIATYRDRAYYEARDRVRGRCVDGAGSARYWTRVKLEIAKRQGISIGLSGADMRA